jgi:hypothetical protein
MKLWRFFVWLSVAACTRGTTKEDSTPIASNSAIEVHQNVAEDDCHEDLTVSNFEVFVPRFIRVFNRRCWKTLDGIVATYGLFVLTNPGSSLIGQRYPSFSAMMGRVGSDPDMNLDRTELEVPVRGEYPRYDCENEARSLPNSIFGEVPPKLQLTNWFTEKVDFPDPDARMQADAATKKISHFIYDDRSNTGLIFARVDSRWVLIALDKIVPCSG